MKDRIPRGLQHCPKMCYKKGGYCRRQACMIAPWRCNFQTNGLAYDIFLKSIYVKHAV